MTGGGDFGTEPGKIKTLVAVYAPENAIYLGSTQDGKQVGVQTATDGGHPVTQLQTLLAPGESTTFRVAYLGDAKFANAGVEAISTPGVKQGKVEPLRSSARTRSPRAEREPYVRARPRTEATACRAAQRGPSCPQSGGQRLF